MFFCVTREHYQGRQICMLVSLRAEVSAERGGFEERRAFHFCFPNEHQDFGQGQCTLVSQEWTLSNELKRDREMTTGLCVCFTQNADIMLMLTTDYWSNALIKHSLPKSNWVKYTFELAETCYFGMLLLPSDKTVSVRRRTVSKDNILQM